MPTYTGTKAIDLFAAPTSEDCTIIGKGGDDILSGNGGNDIIFGGVGHDILDGGEGNDTFMVGLAGGLDTYSGGGGNDVVVAIADNVYIGVAGFTGIEEFSAGGFANVTIRGTTGDDILDFSAITLTGIAGVFGNGGNDTIIGTAFADTLTGGNGEDSISGGDSSDIIDGGRGNDLLSGGKGDDTFLVGAGAGFDTFKGGTGYDTISANADNAVIRLTTGSFLGIEEINSGGFGNVTIAGTAEADTINLAKILISDGDIAAINAGGGDDNITGSRVADTISGGFGNDTIVSGNGDDIVAGNVGDDSIDGGGGFDMLTGGAGLDRLIGGFGDDNLHGGTGDDLLFGGRGLDILTGGAGADIFEDSLAFLKGDTITDFGAGDMIHITGLANPAAVTLTFADGFLSIDPDGAGAGKAIAIQLDGTFTTADFLLTHGANDLFIGLI